MSFFQRIANYLASEVITKQLANSKAFQQAALKTHETVQSSQEVLKNSGKKLAEHGQNFQKDSRRFMSEFADELMKQTGAKK